jgi:hypothetical protein
MRRAMGQRLLVVVACALSASCGTFRNFYNDTNLPDLPYRQPYGGVQIDVILGVEMFTDEDCGRRGWPACVLQRVLVGPYLLSLDLLASALLDTVTLPATSSAPDAAQDSPPAGGARTRSP